MFVSLLLLCMSSRLTAGAIFVDSFCYASSAFEIHHISLIVRAIMHSTHQKHELCLFSCSASHQRFDSVLHARIHRGHSLPHPNLQTWRQDIFLQLNPIGLCIFSHRNTTYSCKRTQYVHASCPYRPFIWYEPLLAWSCSTESSPSAHGVCGVPPSLSFPSIPSTGLLILPFLRKITVDDAIRLAVDVYESVRQIRKDRLMLRYMASVHTSGGTLGSLSIFSNLVRSLDANRYSSNFLNATDWSILLSCKTF